MNSKNKGKTGELELASLLRQYGFGECRRGKQYSGSEESPDITGLPFIHIECKRVEKLNLETAYRKAKEECKKKIPVIFHRRNRQEWMVTMSMDDFMRFYTFYEERNNEL